MGVFSDLLAGMNTVDMGGADGLSIGRNRALKAGIEALKERQGDLDYPSGFDATDEVQSIAVYSGTVSGGTFTLAFVLADGSTFTTAAIAHSANAATIEAAIDTASPAAIGDGDIAVTGGPLTTTPLTLTYSGASVAGANHGEVVIDGALLTGGGTAGDESVTTEGQTKRTPWAALKVSGVIAGTPPTQGTSAAVTAATTPATNPYYPDQDLIRALAYEAAVDDNNADVETAILAAAKLS